MLKNKLAIYSTRSYAIKFLANNLDIAKIVLLCEDNLTQQQADMVL